MPVVHSGNMLRLLGANHSSFGLLRVLPPEEMCKKDSQPSATEGENKYLTGHIEKATALAGIGKCCLELPEKEVTGSTLDSGQRKFSFSK